VDGDTAGGPAPHLDGVDGDNAGRAAPNLDGVEVDGLMAGQEFAGNAWGAAA
jgi:hypothetical protein